MFEYETGPYKHLKNGYQYDSKGKRVRVNGKLTKKGEVYLHHDTCACKKKR